MRISGEVGERVEQLLDDAKLSFTRKTKFFYLTVDAEMLKNRRETFVKLAGHARESWPKG